jgi:hypothetical protein
VDCLVFGARMRRDNNNQHFLQHIPPTQENPPILHPPQRLIGTQSIPHRNPLHHLESISLRATRYPFRSPSLPLITVDSWPTSDTSPQKLPPSCENATLLNRPFHTVGRIPLSPWHQAIMRCRDSPRFHFAPRGSHSARHRRQAHHHTYTDTFTGLKLRYQPFNIEETTEPYQ